MWGGALCFELQSFHTDAPANALVMIDGGGGGVGPLEAVQVAPNVLDNKCAWGGEGNFWEYFVPLSYSREGRGGGGVSVKVAPKGGCTPHPFHGGWVWGILTEVLRPGLGVLRHRVRPATVCGSMGPLNHPSRHVSSYAPLHSWIPTPLWLQFLTLVRIFTVVFGWGGGGSVHNLSLPASFPFHT